MHGHARRGARLPMDHLLLQRVGTILQSVDLRLLAQEEVSGERLASNEGTGQHGDPSHLQGSLCRVTPVRSHVDRRLRREERLVLLLFRHPVAAFLL
uniref:Uncharacterized protein n=1 Tax=Anguilla anguilla TaxID=7936 RepID=A0A0E9XTN1_ANGAN